MLASSGLMVAGFLGYRLLPSGSSQSGEPTINYGQESCARCRMIISNPKFAGAWLQQDGREVHFDDIGCMVLHDGERHLDVKSRYWVHDFDSEEWIDAISATYVRSVAIHSPMNYGVAASRNRRGLGSFEKFSRQLEKMDWNTLHVAVRDSKPQ